MDKVKHALGLDKSGSGGAQGMGDNRLDGHNTYDAKAGGTGINTAGGVGQSSAIGTNSGLGQTGTTGYNSNQGVGYTNAATTGTAPGYQEHHAHHEHEKHHGHHTASGAVIGGVAGGPAGAVVGGVAGHEMGERGQHGHHHNQHGHDGQQKEGMMHKIERKMGMDPEQREAKKEEKALHQQQGAVGAGGLGTQTNSGIMNDNLTGTGVTQGHHHHQQGGLATGQTAGVQTVPVSNIREQAGGFTGQPDTRGNVY